MSELNNSRIPVQPTLTTNHYIVLMACCQAGCLFTMIETGFAGRNSDGGIFNTCAMKRWITQTGCGIPRSSPLKYNQNGSRFPYYFVGDEAFPLLEYLMRPCSKRILDNVKKIFSYRLNQGGKMLECAFGMPAKKFAVVNRLLRCRDSKKFNERIKAAVSSTSKFENAKGLSKLKMIHNAFNII